MPIGPEVSIGTAATTFKKAVITLGLAAAMLPMLVTPTRAALTTISPPCTDTTTAPPFTSCSGAFEGNDTPQTADILTELQSISGTGGWFVVGKSDDLNGGPFLANPNSPFGSLNLDTPITGRFALSLKAANAFSLYYFEAPEPITEIGFDTLGVSVNQQGISQDLSHATLYAVPEPDTYALFIAGLGLLAWAFSTRRRHL